MSKPTEGGRTAKAGADTGSSAFGRLPSGRGKKLTGPLKVSLECAREIVSGRLMAGDYLPTESAVAARYGVSRPAVREGIRRLAASSIVETLHGLGTRVTPPDRWNLFDPLIITAYIDSGKFPEIVDELMDLRRVVEVEAAAAAARNAGPQEINDLKVWLEQMDLSLSDVAVFQEADTAFHGMIVRMSGNRFLNSISRTWSDVLVEGRRITAEAGGVEGRTQAQASHHEIFEAIAARDVTKAREAMEAHMTQFGEDIRRGVLMFANDLRLSE